MSYSKDLEEYADQQLEDELLRRSIARKQGNCSYCNKPANTVDKQTDGCRLHETLTGIVGTFYTAIRQ